MTLHVFNDLEQGSEAWHDARRGMLTASVVGKLITIGWPGALDYDCPSCKAQAGGPCVSLARKTPSPIKTFHDERTAVATEASVTADPVLSVADTDTSRAITATLAAERVAGFTEDTPMSRDMYRGVWSEPLARDLYSGYHQQAVECGFMRYDGEGWTLGLSPDGLVGVDGGLEIKAPRAKTHLLWTLADQVPLQHMGQVQAALLVSGRKWWDFMSYVGGMPLFVKRVYPDPAWFAAIEMAARRFEVNVAELVGDYRSKSAGMPVPERIDFNLEVA